MSDRWKLGASVVLLAGGLAAWGILNRAESRSWPLRAESNPVALGEVDEAIHPVTIRMCNRSPYTVEIAGVRKGCTCQSVRVDQPRAAPGETVPVLVDLDCRGRKGDFRSAIVVDYRVIDPARGAAAADAPILSETVQIEARVRPAAFEQGPEVGIPVPAGAAGETGQAVFFGDAGGRPRKISTARSLDPRIRVEVTASGLFVRFDPAEALAAGTVGVEIEFAETGSRPMRCSIRFEPDSSVTPAPVPEQLPVSPFPGSSS